MTEVKEEVKAEVKEEVKEEVKAEVKAEKKVTAKTSPFVSKDAVITCKVGYYLKPNGFGFIVEGVQDEYEEEKATDFIEVTFRLPSQKDTNIIAQRGNIGSGEGEMSIFKSFNELEYVRFLALLKSWTLDAPCTEESIEELHPSFVKGILTALREKIGMDGIV